MSIREEVYERRRLHGITPKEWQRFKDSIHVGDQVVMAETSVKSIYERKYYRYEVTDKFKWIFKAARRDRRGQEVIVCMAYNKYMTEGKDATVRVFPA